MIAIIGLAVFGVCAMFIGVVAGHIRGYNRGYEVGAGHATARLGAALREGTVPRALQDRRDVHQVAGILADLINPKER